MKPIKTSLPVLGYWDTRIGGRNENQDSCGFIDTPHGLIAIVCDGMGGGPAGNLASSTAVQKIVEYVINAPVGQNRCEIMRNAIEYAHRCIVNIGDENPGLKGMGTTVASVLINKHSAIIAHVGDSRVYQMRMGFKIFRTEDHSMVAELVRNKTLTEEQARLSSQSNIITKALGGNASQLADVYERPYEKGDRFLLCSDGIWGMLPEKYLVKKIARTPSVTGAADSIILEVDETGRKNGNKHDNMTIALFETKTNSKLKEKMSKRILIYFVILAVICLLSISANVFLTKELNKPNESDSEMTQMESTIRQKDKDIIQLQDSIKKLNKEVIKSKLETADAKTREAETIRKAAEEQSRIRSEQAKNSSTVSNNTKNKKIDEIVAQLIKIRDMRQSGQRDKLKKNVISEIEKLAKNSHANKQQYTNLIVELKKDITKSNSDKAKGQYNIIISKLEGLKSR